MATVHEQDDWSEELQQEENVEENPINQHAEEIEDEENVEKQNVPQEQEEHQESSEKPIKVQNEQTSENIIVPEFKPKEEAPPLSTAEASQELSRLHAEVDKALRRSMVNFSSPRGTSFPAEPSHQIPTLGSSYYSSPQSNPHGINRNIYLSPPMSYRVIPDKQSNSETYKSSLYPGNFVQTSRFESPKTNYKTLISQTTIGYQPLVNTSSTTLLTGSERKTGYDKQKLDQILSKISSATHTVNAFKSATQNINNLKSERSYFASRDFKDYTQPPQNYNTVNNFATRYQIQEKPKAAPIRSRNEKLGVCGEFQNDTDSLYQHDREEADEEIGPIQEKPKMKEAIIEEQPRVQKPTKRQLIINQRKQNRFASQDFNNTTSLQKDNTQVFETTYRSNSKMTDSFIVSPKKLSSTHDVKTGQQQANQFKIWDMRKTSVERHDSTEFVTSPKKKSSTHYKEFGVQKVNGGNNSKPRLLKYTHA